MQATYSCVRNQKLKTRKQKDNVKLEEKNVVFLFNSSPMDKKETEADENTENI